MDRRTKHYEFPKLRQTCSDAGAFGPDEAERLGLVNANGSEISPARGGERIHDDSDETA